MYKYILIGIFGLFAQGCMEYECPTVYTSGRPIPADLISQCERKATELNSYHPNIGQVLATGLAGAAKRGNETVRLHCHTTCFGGSCETDCQ